MEDDVLTGYGLQKKWDDDNQEDIQIRKRANSESQHYAPLVKRTNLVALFVN